MMEEFIAFETVIYKAEVPKATDYGTEYNFLKTWLLQIKQYTTRTFKFEVFSF